MRYQSTGGYVPYYTSCGSFVSAGSPSPPVSLCSEPIFQLPMPDGCPGTPGQIKTAKIQILNKTMVDARKKKNIFGGHNIATRFEPPDMGFNFQSVVPFSDHTSDSGNGGIKWGSERPQFRFSDNPSPYPSSPYKWQQLDAPLQCPQWEQTPMGFMQVGSPLTPSYRSLQEQNNGEPPLPPLGNLVSVTVNDSPTRKVHKQNRNDLDSQTSRKSKTKNADNYSKPKPTKKKKGLITSINSNSVKKERTKHHVVLRKQRKRIQQKNKSLHKTELCTHWMLTSNCTFKGKCYFAHGIGDLRKRLRPCNFKTKPCVDCPPKEGKCLFGRRCNYCHPGEALRRAVSSTYFDIDYYGDLKKEFKDNQYPFGIFV